MEVTVTIPVECPFLDIDNEGYCENFCSIEQEENVSKTIPYRHCECKDPNKFPDACPLKKGEIKVRLAFERNLK